MRRILAASLMIAVSLASIHAKPVGKDKKDDQPPPAFKPIVIETTLDANDGVDPKLNQPSKKYTVKLTKDKTYVIDMETKDFDAYLRLLDKAGKQLAEDDDGAGDLNSRIIYSANATEDHQIVAATLDGQTGKFTLKVRELNVKAEAKARALQKDGFDLVGELKQADSTDLAKLSMVVSLQLKQDQAYFFEIDSGAFDCELYVFDGKSRLLGHDSDRVIASATGTGPHNLVIASFDNRFGKFNLKIRAFTLKGEAKPRAVGKDGISITANINVTDITELGKLARIYSVQLKAGQTYTIDLSSPDNDSYLYLFDAKTRLLAQDDDAGGDLHSRITFRAEADGVFHIVATTLDGSDTGEFTLKVRRGE